MTAAHSYTDNSVFEAIDNMNDVKETNDKNAVYMRLDAVYKNNRSIATYKGARNRDCLINAVYKENSHAVTWLLDEKQHKGHYPNLEYKSLDGSALELSANHRDEGKELKRPDPHIQVIRDIQTALIAATVKKVGHRAIRDLIEKIHNVRNIFFLKEYLKNHYKTDNPGKSNTLRSELIWAIQNDETHYIDFLITRYPTLYHGFMRNVFMIQGLPYTPLIEAIEKGKYDTIMKFLDLYSNPTMDDKILIEKLKVRETVNNPEIRTLSPQQRKTIMEKIESIFYPVMHAVKTATPESQIIVAQLNTAYKQFNDIHCKDLTTGTDAFKEAIKKNIPAVVNWFLDAKAHKQMPNKADKDKESFTAYMHAVNFADDDKKDDKDQTTVKRKEIQDTVLNKDFKPDWETIEVAAKAGNYPFVEKYKNAFKDKLVLYAIETNNERIFNYFSYKDNKPHFKDSDDEDGRALLEPWRYAAIELAITKGRVTFINKLLDTSNAIRWQVDHSTKLYGALHTATLNKKSYSVEEAKKIAQALGKANIRHPNMNHIWLGHHLDVDFLTIADAAGLYCNAVHSTEGCDYSHLEIAARFNRLNAVNYILAKGFDEKIENLFLYKETRINALVIALKGGHINIVKALFMHPQIPFIQDNRSALERIADINFTDIPKGSEYNRTYSFAEAYNAFYKSHSNDTINECLKKLNSEDIQSLKDIFTARNQQTQLKKLLELKPELNQAADTKEQPPAFNPKIAPPAANPDVVPPVVDHKIVVEPLEGVAHFAASPEHYQQPPDAPSLPQNNNAAEAPAAPGGPPSATAGPQPTAAPQLQRPILAPAAKTEDRKTIEKETPAAETIRSISPPKPDEKTAAPAEPTPTFNMFSVAPSTVTSTSATSTKTILAAQSSEIKISPKSVNEDNLEISSEEGIVSPPRSASPNSPQFFQPTTTTTITPPTNELTQVDMLSNAARLMYALRGLTENFNKQHPITPEMLKGLRLMFQQNAANFSRQALEASQKEIEGQAPQRNL